MIQQIIDKFSTLPKSHARKYTICNLPNKAGKLEEMKSISISFAYSIFKTKFVRLETWMECAF